MNVLKLKSFLLFCVFLFISSLLFSQNKGGLRVYTIPQDAIIMIDTMRFASGSSIELDSGVYELKIWSPTRKLVTKTVEISEGFYKTLSVKLPQTKEYNEFRRKLHVYSFSRFSLRYGPLIAFGIISGGKLFENSTLNSRADRYENEALEYKEGYENSFWEVDIVENRLKFNERKEKYNDVIAEIDKNNKAILMGAGVTVVASFFTWKLSEKLTRPEFKEEPKLVRLNIVPTFSVNSTGLYIKFQF